MEKFFKTFGNIEAFKYMADSIRDLIFIMKVDQESFRYVFINQSAAGVLQKTNEEIKGKTIEDVMPKELASALTSHYQHVAKIKSPMKFEAIYHQESGEFIGEVSLNPIITSNGNCEYIMGIVRDVTEKWKHYRELKEMRKIIRENEQALKYQKQQYESLFINHPDAIFTMDLTGVFTSCNPAAEILSGYSSEELIGKSFADLLDDTNMENTAQNFNTCIKEKRAVDYEIDFSDRLNNKMNLRIANIPIVVDNRIEGVFGTARDITEEKRHQNKLAQMAYYDYLTGLSNRRVFDEKLEVAIENAALTNMGVAVMMLDGYSFKNINDTYGHDAGDAVLIEMANRIKRAVRKSDIVARLGGDELAIILPNLESMDIVEEITKRILQSFQNPLYFNQYEIPIKVSIGIAFYPEHAGNKLLLIKNADKALYTAKRQDLPY